MPTLPAWLYQLIGLCVVGCLAFAAKWWTSMDTPDGLAKLRTTSPRLAAVVSIVDGLGINVPQVLGGLLVLFKGKWPARLIMPVVGVIMVGCSSFATPQSPGWTYVDEGCVIGIHLAGGSSADASAICGPGISVVEQIVAWFESSKGDAGPAPTPPPAAVEALAKYRAAKAAHTIDAGGQ